MNRCHHRIAILSAATVSASVLALCAAPCGAAPQQLETADGHTVEATFVGIAQDWQVSFRRDARPMRVPGAELVRWGNFADAKKGVLVILDRGLLVAREIRLQNDQFEAETTNFGSVKIPLERIRGVVLEPPVGARDRDALVSRIESSREETDRLILENHDELSGTVLRVAGNLVIVERDGRETEVETASVEAIAFAASTDVGTPAGAASVAPAKGLRCWVGFGDGSRLLAERASTREGQLRLHLDGVAEFVTPVQAVVALQPLGGAAVYLSDLKAGGYRSLPYLDLKWPYKNDRTVTGGLLRARGVYLKGIGMHSASRLTFDLAEPYRRFETDLAIDDETGEQGSVTVSVFIDEGNGTWQSRFKSPVVRGGAAPQKESVDIRGAKRLSLLVEFADRADTWDHVDLGNARLSR